MRHFWICGCVLLLAACAGGDYAGPSAAVAPPPQRQGPQFVNHETVDWTPLNPIVAIRLEGLHEIERSVDLNKEERSVEKIELQIFPSAKSISLDAVPVGSGAVGCIERGQSFDPQLVASPGADVSDQMTCFGQNFERNQMTLNYSTTSKISAGTLTIDGKARIISDMLDDAGRAKERWEYTIEVHGSLQISGTTCRVISWRHDFPNVVTDLRFGSSMHYSNTLTAAADTTCTVVTEKKAS